MIVSGNSFWLPTCPRLLQTWFAIFVTVSPLTQLKLKLEKLNWEKVLIFALLDNDLLNLLLTSKFGIESISSLF